MLNQVSPELEALLQNSFQLRQTLSQVLPPEAVNYLMRLVVLDGAHRNFLKLTEEEN
jgi:hypothetical protein